MRESMLKLMDEHIAEMQGRIAVVRQVLLDMLKDDVRIEELQRLYASDLLERLESAVAIHANFQKIGKDDLIEKSRKYIQSCASTIDLIR